MPEISVDDPAANRRRLRIRIMRELCPKDANARNNGRPTDFPIDDELRGGYEMQYLNQELPIFQNETGYIELLTNRRITLTHIGRQHCNDPDEAF
jgi:hypothetical protein